VDLAGAGTVRAGGQLLEPGQRPLVLAAAVRRLGRVGQQVGAPGILVAAQLQGQAPVAVGLGEAVELLGGAGGGDHRGQGPGRFAGLPPVVGQPRVVGRARDGLQRLGVAAVPGGPLGRQHLVLQHLGDDLVPQPVPVVRAGHEPVRDRRPDRLDQLGLGQRQDPGQQRVLDRLHPGGHRVHHVVGVRGQLVDPGQVDLPQGVGELDPPVPQVPGELLDDERVAAAALVDPVRVLRLDAGAGDRRDQLQGGVAVERGQVEHAYGPQPPQLGQHPP
jgi:hypothetical protein